MAPRPVCTQNGLVTLTRRQVRALLDEHGLTPSRALGQNFVVDPNTVRRMATLAGVRSGDHVIEVGAGLGSLTLALAETGAEVTAIEVDRYLVPVLRKVVEPVGVRVIRGDALTLDWDDVLGIGNGSGPLHGWPGSDDPGQTRWTLVANLPYNIATPVVLHLLEHAPAIRQMLVMVQREVGERLAAGVGDPGYGIPSVKVAYWASTSLAGRVPASVFLPRPRVDSVLVRLVRHSTPPVDADRARLFDLVESGFAQRRKMLRRSLAGMVDADELRTAGIRPEARAEELALQDWARLAGGRG